MMCTPRASGRWTGSRPTSRCSATTSQATCRPPYAYAYAYAHAYAHAHAYAYVYAYAYALALSASPKR